MKRRIGFSMNLDKDYSKYQLTLLYIIFQTQNIANEIYENMFRLACEKMWKEWEENQPIGTEINITDEMLRNTGDENIDLLWELFDKIEEVKERMKI